MTVCLFGIYDSHYSRNRVVLSGFVKNGWRVIECQVDPKVNRGIKKYYLLAKKLIELKKKEKIDLLWVAFPGQTVVWLAYLLFSGRIVFDAFLSLYNSEVEDRGSVSSTNWRALYYWCLDWVACVLATDVILDTYAHIDYFTKKFGLPKAKFHRLFVGTTIEDFYPITKTRGEQFLVHFHGSNIPLQGLPTIITAARLLVDEEIKFNIIAPKVKESLPKNVSLISPVNLFELNNYIAQADVVLGIFGSTLKAKMVIPNKVYEGLATRRPVITATTPAIRELLVNKENALLCELSDPEGLARAILELKNNEQLKDKLAEDGYNLFVKNLVPELLIKNLIEELKLKSHV